MSRLLLAITHLEAARRYTQGLIKEVAPNDWFRMPEGCPTHLAWQIGHITMAQYGLCLVALREMQPEDKEILPRAMRRKYGKGTSPDANPASNPPIEEILAAHDAILQQFLQEIGDHQEEDLTTLLAVPHPLFNTKLEAIEFASIHEMLHAGQIGLLRRMLGMLPLR